MENSIQISIALLSGYIIHAIISNFFNKKELKIKDKHQTFLIKILDKNKEINKDDFIYLLIEMGLWNLIAINKPNNEIIESFEKSRNDKELKEFSKKIKYWHDIG